MFSRGREPPLCVPVAFGDGLLRRGIRGTVQDVAAGLSVELRPGVVYSVGIGDEHVVTARTELKLVCVFAPPLHGAEEAD